MVTGISFTYLTRDQEGRRDYWKRVIDFKRIPAKWYLVIFLFVPILNSLPALLDVITERADTFSIVLWFVAAIAVSMIWGASTLKRQDNAAQPLYPQSYAK